MQAHLDDYARSHGVPQVRIKGMEYPEKQQVNNLIPISSILHRSKSTSTGSISGKWNRPFEGSVEIRLIGGMVYARAYRS